MPTQYITIVPGWGVYCVTAPGGQVLARFVKNSRGYRDASKYAHKMAELLSKKMNEDVCYNG